MVEWRLDGSYCFVTRRRSSVGTHSLQKWSLQNQWVNGVVLPSNSKRSWSFPFLTVSSPVCYALLRFQSTSWRVLSPSWIRHESPKSQDRRVRLKRIWVAISLVMACTCKTDLPTYRPPWTISASYPWSHQSRSVTKMSHMVNGTVECYLIGLRVANSSSQVEVNIHLSEAKLNGQQSHKPRWTAKGQVIISFRSTLCPRVNKLSP